MFSLQRFCDYRLIVTVSSFVEISYGFGYPGVVSHLENSSKVFQFFTKICMFFLLLRIVVMITVVVLIVKLLPM